LETRDASVATRQIKPRAEPSSGPRSLATFVADQLFCVNREITELAGRSGPQGDPSI